MRDEGGRGRDVEASSGGAVEMHAEGLVQGESGSGEVWRGDDR